MGRPHRRGTDVDLDSPHLPNAYQYERPPASYDDPYPARGRSPGPRRRGRSEPAGPPVASYEDYDRHPEPKKESHESRKHRKGRMDRQGTGPDDYAHPLDHKTDRNPPRDRYHNDDAYPRRARSHGRSAGGPHRAADDRQDFDAYAPASRRGRERQHAYHPPRTSETRRSNYPEYDPGPHPSDRRRSRHADYDAEPRLSDRRRSRHADHDGGVPRGTGVSHRSRHTNYDADPRSAPRNYVSPGRGRYRNHSPDQNLPRRSVRGRSMPRNTPVNAAAGGARPRAKSAVGYAALGEAAQTAFRVGSQAAYQMRNDPGPWIGEKGGRVATAALGAALVDTFVGHKATNMKGGKRHQVLRQACEMGIRNFVMTPAVNNVNRRTGSGGRDGSGRKRR